MSILLLVIIGVSVSYAIGYNTGIKYEKKEVTNQLHDFPDLVKLRAFLAENKIDENIWKDKEYTC